MLAKTGGGSAKDNNDKQLALWFIRHLVLAVCVAPALPSRQLRMAYNIRLFDHLTS